jgi:hypothetical protein
LVMRGNRIAEYRATDRGDFETSSRDENRSM